MLAMRACSGIGSSKDLLDRRSEERQIDVYGVPNDVAVDVKVRVDQPVTHRHDRCPR